jgi:hypothetical protein
MDQHLQHNPNSSSKIATTKDFIVINLCAREEDIVGLHDKATSGEDIADCEDLACAVVRSRLHELARALCVQTPSPITDTQQLFAALET